MDLKYDDVLKSKMSEESYKKLMALENQKVYDHVGYFAQHCNPASIYVCDDSPADEEYVRKMAIEKGEEHKLAKEGQTIHWDGYGDQARDKANTKFMVYKENLERMKSLNSVEYEEGLAEIQGIAKNIMDGKDAVVKFFAEGPTFSEFTRPCIQFTDSWYVLHSEQILYRNAYEHFKAMKTQEEKDDIYRFIHSAGQLDDRGCTVNLDKRRIYMDTQNNIVYSMNAQYAGNSVGLKKHSMRLAINQSGQEGWLCEHMFLMAATDNDVDRKTYFAGAFPSACGKTSTAMIPGEEVVGDDIAYFRNIDGQFRAVNVEQGIFGIIKEVNAEDDPLIFKNLFIPQELIFSNVLRGPDNKPYWIGMGMETPKEGDNHSGPGWYEGKKDSKGQEIGIAHSNSRYTMRLDYLDNFDKEGFEDKKGVQVQGVLYGGRDSDTTVPVEESRNWEEGIVLKASTLESETTSATLGAEGVRKASPMANLDFVSYPLGEYTMNNIDFVKGMKDVPKVYSTNYFLKGEDGKFINPKTAKKVWLHWAEKRVHGELDGYETPTGIIPTYEDISKLYKKYMNADYDKATYEHQFSFRCDKWIEKLERTKEFYHKMDTDTPKSLIAKWDAAIEKIKAAQAKYGNVIKPGDFKG
ncbi:MAG: phosphoenolpyruvate carboxykinase (GTP) [Spirochaetaceae bacterium]|nr:phosphoenolpyruvate carboxykinase (GTP) [Spirochaetaceae bacterium]MCF7949038.1 phosphoenolpyruvate carboxykinase (GTP) [Spirochaetia bacterium]MCF7951953.1 phosphoenolpyruvate carboxykinase (GTP) [Spirochaetaceae bacterium]